MGNRNNYNLEVLCCEPFVIISIELGPRWSSKIIDKEVQLWDWGIEDVWKMQELFLNK